jgi:hypothetical protein
MAYVVAEENAMVINFAYGALFLLILVGCAGEPVRVHLPPTHPADRRAQELEFWTIPNPFAETVENAAAGGPAGGPDESAPPQHHGHHSTGMEHSPPAGHSSGEMSAPLHPMQHEQ